jgi:hypothetical protein
MKHPEDQPDGLLKHKIQMHRLNCEIISLMNEQISSFLGIEDLWDALLSRQRDQVKLAFNSLDEGRKEAVFAHLQRMASEPDWHLEQRLSAQAALNALKDEA